MQFRISVGKMPKGKSETGRESHMFQHLLFHLDSKQRLKLPEEPSKRTRWRTNGNNFDELSGSKLIKIQQKSESATCF